MTLLRLLAFAIGARPHSEHTRTHTHAPRVHRKSQVGASLERVRAAYRALALRW